MKGRLIAATTLVLSCSTAAESIAPPVSPAQCEAAWSFAVHLLADRHDRPMVFSTGSVGFTGMTPGRRAWSQGQDDHRPVPPVELEQALVNASALAACPSFRQRLAARHVASGPRAEARALRLRPDRTYRGEIVAISIPAISADERQALLVASNYAGPLGGGGFLVYLIRNDTGQWQIAGYSGLWVS
jgi:hypothetical protein